MKILLVEPEFPVPDKSRNHKGFLPIGLLKIASHLRSQGHEIRLARGNIDSEFEPDQVMITSLFTYWSKYVWNSVAFYKQQYPAARIIVGGIYATLMPEHCKKSGCDEVFTGIYKEAEKCHPAFDLINVDYQVIHTSRGCIRQCKYCGARKLEPNFVFKKSIKDEIIKDNVVFYDNNLLANPFIENILREIIDLRRNSKRVRCESQCGFDGRLLLTKPHLARLLKEAGFHYPKVAWDGSFAEHERIKQEVSLLCKAGFERKEIAVFMLYNWEIDFYEMEKKRVGCWKWGVQISDCRYRPLDQTDDNYKPKLKQTCNDYYIHPKWNDALVKQFRRNVRRQNICVRHRFPYYSRTLELRKKLKEKSYRPPDAWNPGSITPPEKDILGPKSNYFL